MKSKHDSLENFKHIMKADYNKTIKYWKKLNDNLAISTTLDFHHLMTEAILTHY